MDFTVVCAALYLFIPALYKHCMKMGVKMGTLA